MPKLSGLSPELSVRSRLPNQGTYLFVTYQLGRPKPPPAPFLQPGWLRRRLSIRRLNALLPPLALGLPPDDAGTISQLTKEVNGLNPFCKRVNVCHLWNVFPFIS